MSYLTHCQLRIGTLLLCVACYGLLQLPAQDYLLIIDFPEDASAGCGDECIPEISLTDDGCSSLLVNRDTARFDATSDECYKLAITYDVIDWCLWDGEYEGALIRRRTEDEGNSQALDRAVERSERPILRLQGPNSSTLDLTLDRRHNDEAASACGNLDDGSQLPDNDIDYPTDDNVSFQGDLLAGRWRYTQFIKIYDNVAPVVEVPAYGGPTADCPQLLPQQFGDVFENCETEVMLSFTASDACDLLDDSADDVRLLSVELDEYAVDTNGDGLIDFNEFTSDGDASAMLTTTAVGAYQFAGTFPVMQAEQLNQYHTLRVQFEDGCGNRTSTYLPFQVIDCKGPAPSCINGVTINLMPQDDPQDIDGDGLLDNCWNVAYADHFQASAIYDCTGQGPELAGDLIRVRDYAIYLEDVAADPDFEPAAGQDSLFLTENLDPTTFVRIYAFDEIGNYDYCSTYIELGNFTECGGMEAANLSGHIRMEDTEAVEGVRVSVSGAMEATDSSSVTGQYLFPVLELGNDYTVTPFLDGEADNGVTTFDIVLLNKHILGVDTLDSPYKLIAADVNRSESITVRDIIQIRKVILNIDMEFAGNTSWRFIPADYEFPDPTDPWAEEFPEVGNVNDLESPLELDFVAIKVGDVNHSARANSQQE